MPKTSKEGGEGRLARLLQQKKSIFGSALAVLAAAVFPVVFLWGSNAALVAPADVLRPLLLYAAGGLAVYLALLFITLAPAKSALATMAGVLLFASYRFLEDGLKWLVPYTQYWHALTVVVLVAVLLGCVCVRLLSAGAAGNLLKVASLAFAALLAINLVRIVPAAAGAAGQRRQQEETLQAAAQERDLPNFYYFIFDEYSSGTFMEKYYGYDTSSLAESLEAKGFQVSSSSRNANCDTILVTTNVMNLENRFVWEDRYTTAEREEVVNADRKNSRAVHLLEEAGYRVLGLGHPEYYDLEPAQSTLQTGSVTITGETFDNLLLANTPLYPLNKVNTGETARNVQEALAYFETPGSYEGGPTMVLTHLLLPHTPFVFDAEGDAVSVNHFNDWEDPRYYLGQYQYASRCMEQLADTIQRYDPGAVIAFTSDHSARAITQGNFYQNPRFAPQDMAECFQAVYFGGREGSDIEGLSGVNVMRSIFNEVLGTEYDMLPQALDPGYLRAFEGEGGA